MVIIYCYWFARHVDVFNIHVCDDGHEPNDVLNTFICCIDLDLCGATGCDFLVFGHPVKGAIVVHNETRHGLGGEG